jgi:four helix bundle protein
MKYQRFEGLPVWRAAIELGQQVYALTENPAFKNRYSRRDQIERAAVSVSNNIAEGFERGTNQELLSFLYVARGSAGEVRSILYLLEGMPAFRNLESEIRNLKFKTDSISKHLGAWARSLQDSELKGRRYVTEKARQAAERAHDREEFLKELEGIRRTGVYRGRNLQANASKSEPEMIASAAGTSTLDPGRGNGDS